MTKEQALQNELTGTTPEVDTYPNILRAMDAYARQEAVEFATYCEGLPQEINKTHTYEELYDLYLTHKNKSDVKS